MLANQSAGGTWVAGQGAGFAQPSYELTRIPFGYDRGDDGPVVRLTYRQGSVSFLPGCDSKCYNPQ